MKLYVVKGSPRPNGNTNSLLAPFLAEWEALGHSYSCVDTYEKDLRPCLACRVCQEDWSSFHCSQHDDMQEIFDAVLDADLILIATPIYSWYCTPPVKAVLDRLVYGMNKYYGETRGPALWSGTKLALLVTCGYRPENGAGLFEEGMKRYAKHSGLTYLGMLAERHLGYDTVFMDDAKAERARAFARQLSGSFSL